MPVIADLIGQAAADGLARLRMQLGQHQDQAARRDAVRAVAPPSPATLPAGYPECGEQRPVPAAIFKAAR